MGPAFTDGAITRTRCTGHSVTQTRNRAASHPYGVSRPLFPRRWDPGRSVREPAAAVRSAVARLDEGVQDGFHVRKPHRVATGLRCALPAHLPRTHLGRRQDEIAALPWNRRELGTRSWACSSSPRRSRVYGATSSDHLVGVATTGPSRRPMPSSAVSARAPATAGRLRAQGLTTGGQDDGGGRPVGPPPAHHAGVGGRREEAGVEGVCAGYGALGVGAGTAAAAAAACGPRRQPCSGEHGPLPGGGGDQRRVELGGAFLAPGPVPASPSRISRMCARSFPLNAEVHIAPRARYTTCASLRFACLLIGTAVRTVVVPSVSRAEQSGTEQNGADPSRTGLSRAESSQYIARSACAPRVPSLVQPRNSGVGGQPSCRWTPGLAVGFRGGRNCPWPSTITYPGCPG